MPVHSVSGPPPRLARSVTRPIAMCALAVLVLSGGLVAGQSPTGASAAGAPASAQGAPAVTPTTTAVTTVTRPEVAAPVTTGPTGQAAALEGFTYRSEGRRDPFVSLVRRGTDEAVPSHGQGLASLGVGEVSLRGIVVAQGTVVAMVQAPDNRTYLIRQNDTLRDARVKAITPDAVVFLQKVSDPLDVVKEREVRKPLRPNEEGK